MRIPNKLLVPAAVIALGASLAACSISVGSSDGESTSSEQTSAAATTEETTLAATDAEDTQDTDADAGDTTIDDAEDTDADEADGDATGAGASGSFTADITNSDWLGVIAGSTQENVSGDYAIQSSGGTYNLVGELNSLTIQGSEVTVSAESIGTLTVQGSDVTVYVREVDNVLAFGSDVKVYYLDGDPTVQDIGADNTVEQLSN